MPEPITPEYMLKVLDGLSKSYEQLCKETGKNFHEISGSWYGHARYIVDNAKQDTPVIEHE